MSHSFDQLRPVRRVGVIALALVALTAVACERNDDGSYSVDQAFLCVRTSDGAIRWTANKDCGADELLIRVDAPQGDESPAPTSWGGVLAMGAPSPTVPADGAARTVVQLAAEETAQLGPNAKCDLVVNGATTSVLGDLWTWGISDLANSTIEWSDPTAPNSVAVSCAGQSGFTTPIRVTLSLVPVG